MSDSGEDRNIEDWRTESSWYRRKPGAGWLIAFLAIPLLLALIGVGVNASKKDTRLVLPSVAPSDTLTPTAAAPASTTAAAEPATGFAPFSIVRSGNGFTFAGQLPSADMKAMLISTITQALPGLALVDKLTVTPGVKAPGFAGLGGLFSTALDIPEFALKLENDVITLTGSAPTQALKDAAAASAAATWPNVKIVNDVQVSGAAGGGGCATLQADITSLLKTPITFDTNGTTLAAKSSQLAAQIAGKVKACPNVKVAVTGYTDNSGSDAVNVPLSARRAKAVADALVADGITRTTVTSSGAGSADPIAGNDSDAGRAQNRRVEITVS